MSREICSVSKRGSIPIDPDPPIGLDERGRPKRGSGTRCESKILPHFRIRSVPSFTMVRGGSTYFRRSKSMGWGIRISGIPLCPTPTPHLSFVSFPIPTSGSIHPLQRSLFGLVFPSFRSSWFRCQGTSMGFPVPIVVYGIRRPGRLKG